MLGSTRGTEVHNVHTLAHTHTRARAPRIYRCVYRVVLVRILCTPVYPSADF